ncbi:MAG TPA: hypothetical protein VFG89_09650 [Coriobacteriia bacterium]|nr:hypothetical protein [Coriobacteriia bacterium]
MRSRRLGVVLVVLLVVGLAFPAGAWAKNAYSKHIAFARNGYIEVVKSTGTGARRLTGGAADAFAPAWDPAHKNVYFARGNRWLVAQDTTPEQVCVVSAATKIERVIAITDPGAPAAAQHAITSITPSRSGKYLFVADLTRTDDSSEQAIGRIIRVEIGTGATVELLREQAMTWNGYGDLDARPGGSHLMFLDVESDATHLYELKLADHSKRLVKAGIESACYTPGGSQIVASSYFGKGYARDGLRRMTRAGKTTKTLHTWSRGLLMKAWRLPAYSPTGNRIAITKGVDGGLYTINTSGGGVKKVAGGPIAGIDW